MFGRALTLAGTARDAMGVAVLAEDSGANVMRSARRAAFGIAGLARESTGARHRALVASRDATPLRTFIVAGDIIHTDAHREMALADMDKGFHGAMAELVAATSGDAPDSPRGQWMAEDVRPLIAEWEAFAANERASWVTRFATDWSVFETWHERLGMLRAAARSYGIALKTAPPGALPSTFWERGAQGRGGPLETIWTAVKLIVYTAAAFVGIIGLYFVYRDVRGRIAIATSGAGWKGLLES